MRQNNKCYSLQQVENKSFNLMQKWNAIITRYSHQMERNVEKLFE